MEIPDQITIVFNAWDPYKPNKFRPDSPGGYHRFDLCFRHSVKTIMATAHVELKMELSHREINCALCGHDRDYPPDLALREIQEADRRKEEE